MLFCCLSAAVLHVDRQHGFRSKPSTKSQPHRTMSILEKCFVMELTHTRHIARFNYRLGYNSLQEINSHPYLGDNITKYLTWTKHIDQITATANRTLAFVRRN